MLQALLGPAQLSSSSSLSSHSTHSISAHSEHSTLYHSSIFVLPICFLFSYFLIWKSLQLVFSRWALMLLAWIVSLLTLNLALCLFFPPICCRCKEGYHGLRCDQFVPKTDAILSDPSMLPAVFVFVFFSFSVLVYWSAARKQIRNRQILHALGKFPTVLCFFLFFFSIQKETSQS